MKSHTDLPQSKKLAEFLPIKSADMCFNTHNNMPPLMTPYSRFKEFYDMEPTPAFLIPCWSLAALYSILPTFTLDSSDDKYFRIHCCNKFSEWYNNPVDACVAMIEKLHKQNLI